jgi:hypothetical protein
MMSGSNLVDTGVSPDFTTLENNFLRLRKGGLCFSMRPLDDT